MFGVQWPVCYEERRGPWTSASAPKPTSTSAKATRARVDSFGPVAGSDTPPATVGTTIVANVVGATELARRSARRPWWSSSWWSWSTRQPAYTVVARSGSRSLSGTDPRRRRASTQTQPIPMPLASPSAPRPFASPRRRTLRPMPVFRLVDPGCRQRDVVEQPAVCGGRLVGGMGNRPGHRPRVTRADAGWTGHDATQLGVVNIGGDTDVEVLR